MSEPPQRTWSDKVGVMSNGFTTRPLTETERRLAQWMLEHGNPDAPGFLPQLSRSKATTWRCACGCASFNFKVAGEPLAPPGVGILGDFVGGEGNDMFGVFIFQAGGILSGVEVYSLAGEAPQVLPTAEQLRPFPAEGGRASGATGGR